MSKVRRVDLTNVEEEQDLRVLLEKFMQRSEELENRESKVLRQVEMMQSAVASLQAWNQSRSDSRTTSDPVRVDVREVEEETKRIQEETMRIQKEVREKIEENKRLQEEIDRRKSDKERADEFVTESFIQKMGEEARAKKAEREEFESRAIMPSAPPETNQDPGIQFFNEKLNKLRQMELKLKKESDEESEKARKRKRNLSEKIEMLEWESEIDRQLIQALRKKYGKKLP